VDETDIEIVRERASHRQTVDSIVRRAFPTADEVALVRALRDSVAFVPDLSLVATDGERLLGHVLFTEVEIPGTERPENHLVLAPVAVREDARGKGIGSQLIETGIERARSLDYDSVVLHGSTGFYPRFGFTSAIDYGLVNPFNLPDEGFMALELRRGGLDGATGPVRYPEAFAELSD
jgi:predicted N-acetyltransferase YhbS